MTTNRRGCHPHVLDFVFSRSPSRVFSFKGNRSRSKNMFLLGIYLICTFGIILYVLNANGSDNFAQTLISGGLRIYPDGFEANDKLSDEATIDAVQFIEKFLDDVPCDDSWRSQRCYQEVMLLAKRRQAKGTVVLAVVTAGKYEVPLNWCASMRRLGIENYMLVALDHESFEFFSGIGAPIVRLPGSQKTPEKKTIWLQRTLLSYILLRAGVNVLVSDFDAVSVKSPFKSSFTRIEDESLDIITTPSNFPNPDKNELPQECARPTLWGSNTKWAHQPCMGWTFFRSSLRLVAFFEQKLLYDVVKFQDDQIGFNCAIRRAGAVWREPPRRLRREGMITNSKSQRLTLLMLSKDRYVRSCTESGEKLGSPSNNSSHDHGKVEMYHCKGHNKEASARSNGFWFLKENWFNVEKGSRTFNSYLVEITSPF